MRYERISSRALLFQICERPAGGGTNPAASRSPTSRPGGWGPHAGRRSRTLRLRFLSAETRLISFNQCFHPATRSLRCAAGAAEVGSSLALRPALTTCVRFDAALNYTVSFVYLNHIAPTSRIVRDQQTNWSSATLSVFTHPRANGTWARNRLDPQTNDPSSPRLLPSVRT
jgi:hypothetical protein